MSCLNGILMLVFTAHASAGPDVTVFALNGMINYGAAGGIRGYSVGTTSCNVGDTPLSWCNEVGGCGLGTGPADHPVIAQNMYRLKAGRFEQIGASWLKHGFFSVNAPSSGCGTGTCQQPPLGGAQLGVGCIDPYDAGLNGGRPLGRRSEVNPATGAFPFPFGGGGSEAQVWNQRIAVAESDLAAAQNPGARYFVEGHYIAPDDAAAGNGLNNASYNEITINPSFNATLVGNTVRQNAAIQAWKLIDALVQIVNVDLATAPVQRFHVARKVTEITPGSLWHYEYAVHNMNVARAADRFSITFSGPTTISSSGFRDVNAHSNEPYDTTDWSADATATTLQWAAQAFPSFPDNANALRFATQYNFWFDANRPPSAIDNHTLRLFTVGSPTQLSFTFGDGEALFQNGFEN